MEKKPKKYWFCSHYGALHEGHLSLVKKSINECETTIVSIFVNPTQFNNPDDLQTYPRTVESDLKLLDKVGANAVFLPRAEEIYSDGYQYKISESQDSLPLEGEHRPVTSMVCSLLFEASYDHWL